MTVKKAIEILDWCINHKKHSIEQLKEQRYSGSSKVTEVGQALLESERTENLHIGIQLLYYG